MKYPRIRPYRTHSIAADGSRTLVPAYELVLERPRGIDLELNLAPHPGYRGLVTFSTFLGELVLEPDSGGSIYLFIDLWPRGDRRRTKKRRRKRSPLSHVYRVDARGEKNPIAGRRFAIDTGSGAGIEVDFEPPAPWAHHVRVQTFDGPLEVQLIAANVVGLCVARRPSKLRSRV